MAQEGAESSSTSLRSLHWAPLRSWNLFSGRVRSRLPLESPPAQLPRSRSVRNSSEGGRVGSSISRGSGRLRSSEATRKGGDIARRDQNQRAREGSQRQQGGTSLIDEQLARHSSQSASRRRAFHDRQLEASDDWSLVRASRPSAHIAHHQQHHHHDHHHHHYHYHHLYYQHPRRLNEHQVQGSRRPSATGTGLSSHSNRRNSDQRRFLPNRRHTSVMVNSHSRNAAVEARDRLDERLRGAALLSRRHSNAAPLGGFLDDFSVLFDDEEDTWSDDEMWELGIQDWLAAWGYGEGWQADMLLSAEQFPVITGLSKSTIKNLPKEIFVPRVRRRDKDSEDTSLEQDDCSVCLERFVAGQLLIHLPCKLRFHPDCLTPWLESHGQCPYCRAKVGSDALDEASSRATASASFSSNDDDFLAWMGLTMR